MNVEYSKSTEYLILQKICVYHLEKSRQKWSKEPKKLKKCCTTRVCKHSRQTITERKIHPYTFKSQVL